MTKIARVVTGPPAPPPIACPRCGAVAPWTREVCPNCGALPPTAPLPPLPPPRPYDPSPYAAPPSNYYTGLHTPPAPPPGYGYAYGGTLAAGRAPAARAAGKNQAMLGVLLLVVGLVVTFGSGAHLIAYGAIIVGLVNIVAGAAKAA